MITRSRLWRTALLVLTMLSTATLGACTNQDAKGSVTVLGPWSGTEGYAFRKVLDTFTRKTGIKVNYQDTRALSQVLRSSIQGGTPPDVAFLSSPADLASYARNGTLYPLDNVIDKNQQRAFPRPWLLPLNGHIYTVPLKANVKGLIWYNPNRAPKPIPRTWDELADYDRSITNARGTPWCMGMGDGPNSGWPGTDMIEDILLHKFGPDLYQRWAAGKVLWTSDEVKESWQTWGAISANPRLVWGGPRAVLFTHFSDAGRPMLANTPGCYLDHEASFIMGFYQSYKNEKGNAPQPGADFDFFPFPQFNNPGTGGALEVSTDLAGMFTDTPQAQRLIRFLATDEVQQIWPSLRGGSAFTVDQNVPPSVSPDPVSAKIATLLSKNTVCPDASDVMPAAMRDAFRRAVLEYLNHPKQLDTLLRWLDQVQKGRQHEDWLDFPCSQ